MIIKAIVFDRAVPLNKCGEDPERLFFRPQIPLSDRFNRLCAAVTQQAPDQMHAFFKVAILKRQDIVRLMFGRDPQSGFDVHHSPLPHQTFQPADRHINLASHQVAFDHQQRMQRFFMFRQTHPLGCAGKLFRCRFDHLGLLQGIFSGSADTGRGRGVVIHHGCLDLLAQRQRQGRRRVEKNLTHFDCPLANLGQNLLDAGQIPIIFQAFPFCFTDQRVMILVFQRIEHFRTTQALNPQWLAACLTHAHHQGAGCIVAKSHVEQRRCRQHGQQNRLRCRHRDMLQQTFRYLGIAIGEEQKAIIIVNIADRSVGQLPGQFSCQNRQGFIDRPAKNGMHHELMLAGFVIKMLDQDCPVISQNTGSGQLAIDQGFNAFRRILIESEAAQRGQKLVGIMGFSQFTEQLTKGQSCLQAAPFDFTFPKRRPRAARGRGDDNDSVLLHPADLPGEGTKQEFIADPGFKNIFFIEFAQFDAIGRPNGV